jgi:hypothetical protein
MRIATISVHTAQNVSAVAVATLYPVRTRMDMLTATYLVWSYRHLHRTITALDALMHTPALSPPLTSLPPHEYSLAASLWKLQWSIESQESRFAREMMIPIEGHIAVSLRAYVRGLKDRMASAVKRGLFDDLEDDEDDGLPGTEVQKNAESRVLILETRACLTFAFSHDVRWRRVVMRPPGHLFDESAPDRDLAAAFVDRCVSLTKAFIDGHLTLIQVAEDAARCWLYG